MKHDAAVSSMTPSEKSTRRSASEQAITPRFSFESAKYASTGACEYSEDRNPLPQFGGRFLLNRAPVVQRPTVSFSGNAHATVQFVGTDGFSAAKVKCHSSTPFSGDFVSTATDHPSQSVYVTRPTSADVNSPACTAVNKSPQNAAQMPREQTLIRIFSMLYSIFSIVFQPV